jgi:Methylase involved in ubiquinone/menaquinone biosynthesis
MAGIAPTLNPTHSHGSDLNEALMVSDFYQHPDLYDALLPVGAHLPFYSALARQHPEGVLELACGTGQLAVPIAGSGVPIVGLDRSAAMLATARNRATAAGVTCDLVEGDMRAFDLGQRFGLVFIARNSLLHLSSAEDIVAAFKAVRNHLLPDGVFAFDVFNPDPSILARSKDQRFPVMTVDTATFGRLTVESTHDYDAAEQTDRGTWFISAGDERDKWVVSVVVRSIFPQELPLLLQAAGLRVLNRFGSLDKSPFGSGSRHQVCVCQAAA